MKKLKICYYLLLIKKNHISWWLYDNVLVNLYKAIDKMDEIYWNIFIGVFLRRE